MITKDGRDTPIEKLTPDNYIVPKGEEKSYHAIIEVVQYDPKTGKKLSKPRVQKFGKKQFETNVLNSLRKQGYTVTILHDPNVWLKEQAAKAEQAKAEAEQAKAQAEQEKFDAAVDKAVSERVDAAVAAAVAKAIAEQKAKQEQAAKAEQAKAEAEQAKAQAEQAEPAKKPGRPSKTESEK